MCFNQTIYFIPAYMKYNIEVENIYVFIMEYNRDD